MSKNIEPTNTKGIYVYNDGKCEQLHSKLENLPAVPIPANFQLAQQVQTLVTMFSNLADTVNKNALFLTRFEKPPPRTGLDLEAYLKSSNKIYNQMLSTYSSEDSADEKVRKLVKLGSQDEEKHINENILLKESVLEKLFEQNMDMKDKMKDVEERVKNLEVKQDSLEMKMDYVSEFSKDSSNDFFINLEKRIGSLEINLKKVSTGTGIGDELERLENCLSEKITRMNKKIDYLMDNMNKTVESENTDQNENILEIQINAFEEKMAKLEERLSGEIIHVKDDLSDSNKKVSNKLKTIFEALADRPKSNDNENSKPFNVSEFLLNELKERLEDIESEFSKRIITINNKLKEFDDIGKLNKMVSKLNTELSFKLNKDVFESTIELLLYKNDFYDFVNRNLIKKDKLNTFKYEFGEFKEQMKNELSEASNFSKRMRNTFESAIEDLEIKIGRFSKEIGKNDDLVSSILNRVIATENDGKALTRNFKELKQWIVDQLKTRLNSLATSTGIRCLSCGEKDVNYPPIPKHSMGNNGQLYQYQDDKYLYLNGVREEIRPNNENNHNNVGKGESRLFSAKTNPTNNRLFSASTVQNKKSKYSVGFKVFDRNQSTHEHKVKRHHNQQNFGKVKPSFKTRPFSSIQQKFIIRK